MPPPVCSFDGCMMMILHDICQVSWRICWSSLKQSLYPWLQILCWEACSLKKKIILHVLLDYLHWIPSPVLWWGICCGNLQYKIMLFSNCIDVSSYRFPWSLSYFMWHSFVLRSSWLEIKVCGVTFCCFFHLSVHITQYMDSQVRNPDFSIPMWFWCGCLTALSCNDAGTIILLFFHGNSVNDCNPILEWPV